MDCHTIGPQASGQILKSINCGCLPLEKLITTLQKSYIFKPLQVTSGDNRWFKEAEDFWDKRWAKEAILWKDVSKSLDIPFECPFWFKADNEIW